MSYKKWDIVSVDFGISTNLIDEKEIFTKSKIIEKKGINFNKEFSLLHIAIVISPSFLNKKGKLLVIPITSFNPEKHSPNYLNHFVLYKKYYKNLKNDSVLLLNEIRSIDEGRIVKKHNFHLKDIHKKVIQEKLHKIL